jgi:hypothetical protein
VPFLGARTDDLDRVAHDLKGVHDTRLQRHLTAHHPRRIEQIIDDTLEVRDLAVQQIERALG